MRSLMYRMQCSTRAGHVASWLLVSSWMEISFWLHRPWRVEKSRKTLGSNKTEPSSEKWLKGSLPSTLDPEHSNCNHDSNVQKASRAKKQDLNPKTSFKMLLSHRSCKDPKKASPTQLASKRRRWILQSEVAKVVSSVYWLKPKKLRHPHSCVPSIIINYFSK